MVALVVSDVVGDDLSSIGSGPTVPDPSTFEDALRIVGRFGKEQEIPDPVLTLLEQGVRGGMPETLKPGSSAFNGVTTRLIGSVKDAIEGAAIEARRLGYSVARVSGPIVGEARESGARLMAVIEPMLADIDRPVCVLSGGETTVRVQGPGRGGRNQELALGAAISIARLGTAVMASVGTDGIDGPTDAAGAIVDSTTLDRANRLHLAPPEEWFARSDAYEYFKALGDLILTGPTGSNVGDLQVVLVA
jgi:hydroxypyruvate reductase